MQSAKTAAKLPQRPRGFTIWMTGLPGSGKSTLAGMLKEKFEDEYGRFVEVLDGDEVRKGLSRDLGLSREVIGRENFVEVYVKASLETCMKRDPKGLYAKARRGEINNMTGLQDPYE